MREKLYKILSEMQEIKSQIKEIDNSLEKLISELSLELGIKAEVSTADIYSLPDPLRKTALTMMRLKEGTSKQVAEKTGRDLETEQNYLNTSEKEKEIYCQLPRPEGRKVFAQFPTTYLKVGECAL